MVNLAVIWDRREQFHDFYKPTISVLLHEFLSLNKLITFCIEMAKRDATSDLNHNNWDKEEEPEEPGTFVMASKEELQKRVIKKAKRRPDHQEEGGESKAFSGFEGFKLPNAQSKNSFNWGITPSPSLNGSVTQAFNMSSSNKPSFESLFSNSTRTNSTTTTTLASSAPASTTASLLNNKSYFSSSTLSTVKNENKTLTNTTAVSSTVTSTTTVTSNAVSASLTAGKKSKSSDRNPEYYSKLKALNECVTDWICKHVKENPYCILTPIFIDYEKYYKEFDQIYPPGSAVISSNNSTASKLTSVSNPVTLAVSTNMSTVTTSVTPSSVASENVRGVDVSKNEVKETLLTKSNPGVSSFSLSKNMTGEQPSLKLNALPKISLEMSKPPSNSLFSFASTPSVPSSDSGNNNEDNEEYEPPKPDIQTVVEDGAFYTIRCKLFYKKGETFVERGIGMLHLKRLDDGKTQLVIRADTNLGNILLNILLNSSVKTQLTGKNNVLIVCLPNPPIDPKPDKDAGSPTKSEPIPMLIKVKSTDEAQQLLEMLNKHKS